MLPTSLNLKTILRLMLITLCILSTVRLGFVVYFFERIGSVSDVFYILIQGLRVDLVVSGYFFLIPLIIIIWLKDGVMSRIISGLVSIWLIASFTGIVFMEVATPEFIHEYDVRPNRIFVDYLIYPKEVFGMLWEGYKPAIFIGLIVIVLCVIGSFHLLNKEKSSSTTSQPYRRVTSKLALSLVIVFVGSLVIRSSVQHRPFNPSMVFFSHDNLVNSLTLNSTFSVLFAVYNAGSELSAFELYGKLPEKDIIEGVRKAASLSVGDSFSTEYTDDAIPTQRYHRASYQGSPKNIVVLLQESLGARHVGGLGGNKLTPNLDKIMQDGWNFTHAYATGTRSVRGIEAVFTGFSPGPSRAVVKLNKSQTGFFSIASLLKRHGYQTQFIYGGESHFDNMKSFFLGNGINDIHDLTNFNNPSFIGSWGASDEDLYREAHQEFVRMHAKNKPFFSLVFTTSNHSPFDFPEGCLADIQGEKRSMENAIRYSDCALGKFIDTAKQSNYWKDTIFLIIADHDSRTIGAELVPMQYFKIPALVLGNGISPAVDDRLVSQIDFPPTLLSLAGISDAHPMLGYDLTQHIPINKQRAMLQYNENFAWLTREKAVIFQPNTAPIVFNHNGYHLTDEIDSTAYSELLKTSLANALWSSLAYQRSLYRSSSLLLEHSNKHASTLSLTQRPNQIIESELVN